MKKQFTTFLSSASLIALLLVGFAGKAQTSAEADFKPSGKLWGYAFGDFYYNAAADGGPATLGARGKETNYNGVPTDRNAFQLRRVYLGYDYDMTSKFSASLLLASEPAANTADASKGDDLGDGKMAFYIKNINLRWKGIFTGSDLVMGEMGTPAFAVSEKIWAYRSIEKTVADFHKTNSFDLGAGLQGFFDPATKNYGYNVMVGNNTSAGLGSAAAANTGFFKAYYGDVFGYFADKKVVVDLYADYAQTASSSGIVGTQSHNMFKGFVAYTTPKVTVGAEGYINKIKNGVTATNAGVPTSTDATVLAYSVFARGPIIKDQLGFFARYDGYNPNNDYNSANTYAVNSNPPSSYDAYTKETFATAGLDFTPAKNVHIMPNIWYVQYKDLRTSDIAGYVADGHNLVYRLTAYFVFGK